MCRERAQAAARSANVLCSLSDHFKEDWPIDQAWIYGLRWKIQRRVFARDRCAQIWGVLQSGVYSLVLVTQIASAPLAPPPNQLPALICCWAQHPACLSRAWCCGSCRCTQHTTQNTQKHRSERECLSVAAAQPQPADRPLQAEARCPVPPSPGESTHSSKLR